MPPTRREPRCSAQSFADVTPEPSARLAHSLADFIGETHMRSLLLWLIGIPIPIIIILWLVTGHA